jgi:hypothetical protein
MNGKLANNIETARITEKDRGCACEDSLLEEQQT